MNSQFDPVDILVRFLGFFVAITMSAAGQAIMARVLGDRSAEAQRRSTLNPLPHMDLLGTLIFPFGCFLAGSPIAFGWAKPFFPSLGYFKNPKVAELLVSLAKLLTHAVLAIAAAFIIKIAGASILDAVKGYEPLPRIVYAIGIANVVLGIFQLFPIPGTGLWTLITLYLVKPHIAQKLESMGMAIQLIIFALLMVGKLSFVFDFFISYFHQLSFT